MAQVLPPRLRYQRLCVWSGILFSTLFFVAIVMMGYLPPPPPAWGGAELASDYESHLLVAKLAVPLGILAAGLSIPWNSLIALHIARIEMSDGGIPILAITSFGGGTVNTVAFFFPFLLWAGIFYRTGTPPEVTQMISDITWLEVVMFFSPAFIQNVCLAVAGLSDQSENPVFPRWACFAILWFALMTVPGGLAIFFFGGPFAWNGLFGFWFPAIGFGSYMTLLFYLFFKWISREAAVSPA